MRFLYRSLVVVLGLYCTILSHSSFPQEAANNFFDHIRTLMIDGKNKIAICELNSILQKDSSNADALYCLGLNYEAISDYYNAANAIGKAVKYQPHNIRFLKSLGSDYYYSGLINESETVLSEAFLLDSTDSQIQIMLGKVYVNEKKWVKGCNIYLKLILADSTNSFFYQQLSQCCSYLGQSNEAINYDLMSNKLNPKNQDVILDLTYLLYLSKHYHVALNVLDNSLKYYRCSTSLLKWKGDIYFNISKYDSALYCYHGAIICGDSSGSILKSMGICLYWSKKYSSAINFLEHSIELDPKDYVAYFYLGASYKAQNKLDKAMINFKTADTLLQNTFLSNIYNQIGSVYQQQGKYKEAMEYYKAALKENLLDKSNIFYLAAMFDKLKNQKAALNYYKLYLRDSSNQDGKLIDYANKRISELKK